MGEQLNIKKSAGQKGTHLGTGQAHIERVDIFSDSKVHSAPLLPKKPLTIQLKYSVKKPIEDAVFIVSIFDKNNRKLISSNTEETNLKLKIPKGKGSIKFEILANPLAPGKYKMNAGIFGPRLVLAHDHFRDAAEFIVRGDNWGDYAIITKTHWEINK